MVQVLFFVKKYGTMFFSFSSYSHLNWPFQNLFFCIMTFQQKPYVIDYGFHYTETFPRSYACTQPRFKKFL